MTPELSNRTEWDRCVLALRPAILTELSRVRSLGAPETADLVGCGFDASIPELEGVRVVPRTGHIERMAFMAEQAEGEDERIHYAWIADKLKVPAPTGYLYLFGVFDLVPGLCLLRLDGDSTGTSTRECQS